MSARKSLKRNNLVQNDYMKDSDRPNPGSVSGFGRTLGVSVRFGSVRLISTESNIRSKKLGLNFDNFFYLFNFFMNFLKP